ncbi:hypothetical protein C6501_14290 [Candidatus Poribacteria bacterium]|nr:MAG: hypothetical protein C6501_14290 [Candidatus Poribacteria bacterium]
MEIIMKHFLENQLNIYSLCIILMCSLFIVEMLPADEIIFQPMERGIWQSNINGDNARHLFNPPIIVSRFSIQKGNRYILCVGVGQGIEGGVDAYLFDSNNWKKGRKDLTDGRYGTVLDAAISPNGDVIFSNRIFNEVSDGIYLIPNDEIHEPLPQAQKLYDGPAIYVDWAPNGKEVAFSNKEGIFLLDVFTKEVTQLLDYGYRPVFSPDGSKLAFAVSTSAENNLQALREQGFRKIGFFSLDDPQNVKILKRTKTTSFSYYITWTPDGKSIAYVLIEFKGFIFIFPIFEHTNFVVSIANGKPERILEDIKGGARAFDWTQKSYPVEPKSKLTTTWGHLKREIGNGGKNE